jgi:hypothetical protein
MTAGQDNGQGQATLPVLQLHFASHDEVLQGLDVQAAQRFSGVDLSFLKCELDDDILDRALEFCHAVPALEVSLRLTGNDLGSGGDCEQQLWEYQTRRALKERELAHFRAMKSKAPNQKDFAASAKMRREGQEGVDSTEAAIAEIDSIVEKLDERKVETLWYRLLSRMENQNRNTITLLDLSNCGLHATGVAMLTSTLLELEHRGASSRVSRVVLDGNDLRDISMAPLASYVRLSSGLEALQLRNVGVTDEGLSEVIAGVVSNKILCMLDLRDNGLTTPAVGREVVAGMRRFNKTTEILVA